MGKYVRIELLFTIFKRYLLENGVGADRADHIIEFELDGIENEELRNPNVCFKFIKDAMKDDGKYYLLLDKVHGLVACMAKLSLIGSPQIVDTACR